MSVTLTTEQESQAQQLAALIRQSTETEILNMARLLVSTTEQTVFGATEFQLREVVLRAGAKAYQTFLAQKKTATSAAE